MGINKYPHNSFFEGMSQILLPSNNRGSWLFMLSFAQRLKRICASESGGTKTGSQGCIGSSLRYKHDSLGSVPDKEANQNHSHKESKSKV